MVVWGLFWGACLGFIMADFSEWGLIAGGIVGVGAGLSLKAAVLTLLDGRKKQWLDEVAQAQGLRSPPLAQSQPTAAQPKSPLASSPREVETAAPAMAAQMQPTPSASSPMGALPQAAEPSQPGIISRALTWATNWLMGGNTVARVGLVILFIGLSFLARYAVMAGLIPIEIRLAGIAFAAIALLAFGFLKREQRPAFGLALQGTGVAVLYLVVFSAARLYPLLAPTLAFGLMIVITALGCVLALLQNSRTMALASFSGGFAVPLLLSTGQGSHIGLFGYYTVLNLALLAIAYQRAWRALNLLGFLATFGVASTWGVLKYQAAHYATTQPFLALFVLIYVAAAIAYARKSPTALGNTVDSTLVFGTALIGFTLQAGLTQSFELGTAFSALVFGAIYLILATLLRQRGQAYHVLWVSFASIGIGFATLAVPLALDAHWTAGVWALEGAAAFWVGAQQRRWAPRMFGLLLQALAIVAYASKLPAAASTMPILNPAVLGALLIALPLVAIAWWSRSVLAHDNSRWAVVYARIESGLSNKAFLLSFGFLLLACWMEFHRRWPLEATDGLLSFADAYAHQNLWVMLGWTLTALAATQLSRLAAWPIARLPGQFIIAVLFGTFLSEAFAYGSVLWWQTWAIWLGTVVAFYYQLYTHDKLQAVLGKATAQAPGFLKAMGHANHAAGVILLMLLLADALRAAIASAHLENTAWASVIFLISGTASLVLLTKWAGQAHLRPPLKWPLNTEPTAYYSSAGALLALLVGIAVAAIAASSSGQARPLPYIPILNPTDLALALALAALALWRGTVKDLPGRLVQALQLPQPLWVAVWAGLCFVVLNTVWLRIAHHYFDVPWQGSALFNSFLVQTGYAILWTVLALGLMLFSHRQHQRTLWLVGAGLLALVVVKLVLIDLSNAGGGERIIAFIGVGVLMVVVGYLAPIPPKLSTSQAPNPSTSS
jgi:uncharacterized membrane protein